MARRLPSPPPNLAGFSYVRPLGSGGFADVFLYEQNMPRRQVAVKVLLAEVVNDQVRQLFQAEANLMAQLSSHPSILTVFQASVSADGRPYMVTEYCSSTLSQRYRSEPLAVADVLRIGITVSGAVEAAHRAGVLHRDIKPSNILVTAYGHPVLSDFGIAATVSEAEHSEAVGLSIPWSAPEVLRDEVSGSVASEVWSLGATIYSLLAGRSPFELPGSENTSAELMARIQKAVVPPIGRDDVPPRLESILRRAMSKRPSARQQSALELVRELQSIEAELGYAQTPLDLMVDEWAGQTAIDPHDQTRISPRTVVGRDSRPRRRAPSGHQVPHSSHSRSTHGNSAPPARGRRGVVMLPALITASVLVVGLAAVSVSLLAGRASSDIPSVTNITGTIDGGTIVFSWSDPGLRPDDSYVVMTGTGESSVQRQTQFAIDPRGVDRVCIRVTVSRQGTSGAPSRETCVDVGSAR
ncbi:serine/threonine-protein kinase [Cryobacterium tepidiphilum]|uniref:non-specific serine/threonine protein kinase n=1 Tax=Cryobacterium tepidiphilum TaxID=2486026 RepID=A0A3M8LDW6_9MICO|nr:serine/threonine-protein kinase [Cryobacterium tepidiphilum]RNE63671.1 serine/threonine protein kinase [Cryobacterium tepidiphilum]